MVLLKHSRAVLSSMQGVEQPRAGCRVGDGESSIVDIGKRFADERPPASSKGRGTCLEPRGYGTRTGNKEQGTKNKGTRANSK